jgi:hypothetical protein
MRLVCIPAIVEKDIVEHNEETDLIISTDE